MASSIKGLNSTYRSLIESRMSEARGPLKDSKEEKDNLQDKKSLLSDLDTKLSKLDTELNSLTDPVFNPFKTKAANSSDEERVSVSAGINATKGEYSISVDRLATTDKRVSAQFNNDNTDFSPINSDQTFSIDLAHPTQDDSSNRKSIDITISSETFSKSNKEVLQTISEKINDKMNSAIADGDIRSKESINSSVVNQIEGTSRLTLKSSQTGYDYRMGFEDSSDNLLSKLGINNSSKANDTEGGYITEIGDSQQNSKLNSKFNIDGLTYYRNSNRVEDAIDGLTINLNTDFTENENISVALDKKSVKKEVKSFIDKYNKSIDFFNNKVQFDTDSNEDTPLSSDMTYSNMEFQLRNKLMSTVDGATSDQYDSLRDIGISMDDKGKLSLDDENKFDNALKESPDNVSKLFRADDGIANKTKEYLDSYISAGGIISNSKKNIDNNINFLDDQIQSEEEDLNQLRSSLRDKYSRIQGMMKKFQNQQQQLKLYS